MEMFSATRLPERMESFRLPRVTGRPTAWEKLRLKRRAKGIGVDEERYEQNRDEQENDNRKNNLDPRFLHGDTSAAGALCVFRPLDASRGGPEAICQFHKNNCALFDLFPLPV